MSLKQLFALALALLVAFLYCVHGLAFAAPLAFLSLAALSTASLRRGECNAAPNTNDIASELQLSAFLGAAYTSFRRAMAPLAMFSTVFKNVVLRGNDKVEIPYYPLQGIASKDFSGTYDFATGAGSKSDVRELGGSGNWKRKYQPIQATSSELARQPRLNLEQMGAMKGEKLAYDIQQDIFSCVTAANFGPVGFTGTASTFDSDDVVDLRTAAANNKTGPTSVTDGVTTNGSAVVTSATARFTPSDIGSAISGTGIPASTTIAGYTSATSVTLSANATADGTGITFTMARVKIPWPETGRGLLITPDYDGNLLKDANFRRDLTVAGQGTMNLGQFPRVYNFDYAVSAAIPSNGENLVGMIAFKSALLVATSPIQPADKGKIVDYRVISDGDIALEYREWFDGDTDTLKKVIEANYCYAPGEKLALKRLVSA